MAKAPTLFSCDHIKCVAFLLPLSINLVNRGQNEDVNMYTPRIYTRKSGTLFLYYIPMSFQLYVPLYTIFVLSVAPLFMSILIFMCDNICCQILSTLLNWLISHSLTTIFSRFLEFYCMWERLEFDIYVYRSSNVHISLRGLMS